MKICCSKSGCDSGQHVSGQYLSLLVQGGGQRRKRLGHAANGDKQRRQWSPQELCAQMADVEAVAALDLFSDLSTSGRLKDALDIVESAVKARREDILGRYFLNLNTGMI